MGAPNDDFHHRDRYRAGPDRLPATRPEEAPPQVAELYAVVEGLRRHVDRLHHELCERLDAIRTSVDLRVEELHSDHSDRVRVLHDSVHHRLDALIQELQGPPAPPAPPVESRKARRKRLTAESIQVIVGLAGAVAAVILTIYLFTS